MYNIKNLIYTINIPILGFRTQVFMYIFNDTWHRTSNLISCHKFHFDYESEKINWYGSLCMGTYHCKCCVYFASEYFFNKFHVLICCYFSIIIKLLLMFQRYLYRNMPIDIDYPIFVERVINKMYFMKIYAANTFVFYIN